MIEGFRKIAAVTPRKRKARDKSVRVEENIIRVKVHYENDPKTSIRLTAKDLQLSYQSVRRILEDDLKIKPYKMWRCQELTDQHKDHRMEFCCWFMEEDIDPQLIIFFLMKSGSS